MATSDQPSARFRSATEFPKSVDKLGRSDANQLYVEMRECLIFTNRSRAQLIRRNEEHKNSALQLKTDVERLQAAIQQINLEKQQLAESDRLIISSLKDEINPMSRHLDQLAIAFDVVSDVDNQQQTQWSFLAMPGRFFNFMRAVKAIVLWWREDKDEDDSGRTTQVVGGLPPQLPGGNENNDDRRDHPQMYTDPASQGRSLLDK